MTAGTYSAWADAPPVWCTRAADGGVFRSTDDGATWMPIADHLPSLSVGSLAIAPDGALWLGTGEAEVSSPVRRS